MSLITFGVTLSGVSYLCQDAAELWASGRAHSCCVVLTPDITPSLSGSTAQASILTNSCRKCQHARGPYFTQTPRLCCVCVQNKRGCSVLGVYMQLRSTYHRYLSMYPGFQGKLTDEVTLKE